MKVMVKPIVIGMFGMVPQMYGKETGGTGNQRKNQDYQNYSIVKKC